MPSRRPRRKPGINRELLIEAGVVEFGLSGYRGTSTNVVAARAGVPQPHLYASFDTKKELFLACLERAASIIVDGADDETVLASFLYQAVASARDPQLSETIIPFVRDMICAAGERRFAQLLARGGLALLIVEEIDVTTRDVGEPPTSTASP